MIIIIGVVLLMIFVSIIGMILGQFIMHILRVDGLNTDERISGVVVAAMAIGVIGLMFLVYVVMALH